ncbi:sensor histidine kinase [Flammeovirgaceae bacterium SG7u.111]|nr:sensor histidine kinase [Flammeovirgaceae bacterium SG7u.132]WPO33300.1 sensor histidine kinase [Flammeovirgaceae bacterium SG7u.111]
MTLIQKTSNVISCYKLDHVAFWVLYEGFWSAMYAEKLSIIGLLVSLAYLFAHATGSYFNVYYLVPKFLKKGKYFIYIITLVLTIACSSILIILGYFLIFLPEPGVFGKYLENEIFFQTTFASSFSTIVLVMIIKLAKEWINANRQNQRLEKEKLETELQFLKAQLNPHFLFNTINSIFFLIHKDQNEASEALAKFSELLRYQLYESNEEFIPLRKELEYLTSYTELEKLRKGEDVVFESTVELEEDSSVQIAPHILLAFLENAFKHLGEGKEGKKYISLHLKAENGSLFFKLENTCSTEEVVGEGVKKKSGGIGLQNVKRRLALLYGDKHTLVICRQNNLFSVNLELNIASS